MKDIEFYIGKGKTSVQLKNEIKNNKETQFIKSFFRRIKDETRELSKIQSKELILELFNYKKIKYEKTIRKKKLPVRLEYFTLKLLNLRVKNFKSYMKNKYGK